MLEHTISLKKRLLPCLILAVLALLLSRTAGAQAASVQPNCGSWGFVKSPNAPPFSNDVLSGVSAVSATDVWAVGSYISGSTGYTLTEHWDGTRWSIISSPNVGTGDNSLAAVAAVSATDVWAVGTYIINGYQDQTLIEHWDGTSWSVVSSPNPGSDGNYLSGIAVVAANDIWAVGASGGPPNTQVVIEHWDGTSWSVVPSNATGELFGVAAISTNDVWAVGGFPTTLIEHWDGTSWSVIPSPKHSGLLDGVVAISTNDVWAVGSGFIEQWNGSSWAIVAKSPGDLGGVAAISSNDVWAVGDISRGRRGHLSLIEHWNGASWSAVPSPRKHASLTAVTQVPGTSQAWSVGTYTHQYEKTLTEFYC